MSKENDSSSSREKKDITNIAIKDKEADAVLEKAEMTDERTNDGMVRRKEKLLTIQLIQKMAKRQMQTENQM